MPKTVVLFPWRESSRTQRREVSRQQIIIGETIRTPKHKTSSLRRESKAREAMGRPRETPRTPRGRRAARRESELLLCNTIGEKIRYREFPFLYKKRRSTKHPGVIRAVLMMLTQEDRRKSFGSGVTALCNKEVYQRMLSVLSLILCVTQYRLLNILYAYLPIFRVNVT